MREVNRKEVLEYKYWELYTEVLKLGFDEEEVAIAYAKTGLNDGSFSNIVGVECEAMIHSPVHQVVSDRHSYQAPSYCKSGEQLMESKRVVGIGVRLPCDYQGTNSNKLIRALLKGRFDWFDSFTVTQKRTEKPLDYAMYRGYVDIEALIEEHKDLTARELIKLKVASDEVEKIKSSWAIYDLNQIYLETGVGSIYVNVQDLLNRDVPSIIAKMTKYFNRYYSGKDKDIKLTKALRPLESDTFKKLEQLITTDV